MRLYRFCRLVPGVLLPALIYCSCAKSHAIVNTAQPSVLQYIGQEPSLGLLDTAVGITRLDTVMQHGGPYTFFAPSDSAFLAAGLTADSLRKMDPIQLLQLLEYNVVQGRLSSTAVPGFLKQPFTSLHPRYNPFITKNYYGIFLNGIPVTKGDIGLGDGVVQITSRVAIPPAGSQLDVMDREPDLHFMVALVRNVHVLGIVIADPNPYNGYLGNSNLSGPRTPPYYGNTLLAPTDSAFRAYGYPDTASLIRDSLRVLYDFPCISCQGGQGVPLLQDNILNGFIFTSDFMGQFVIGNSNSQSGGVAFRWGSGTMYTSLDGMSFTGHGIAQGSPVRILKPDIIASNGVVQKINQVFLIH